MVQLVDVGLVCVALVVDGLSLKKTLAVRIPIFLRHGFVVE